ncbi:response regulator [Phycisphaera mikurensis]|uniref:Putative response regulator receiver protein n=1 Tax=Phycisphaera mikurensis (strain NBRC 102666 / KCTC 22515 / FYK2301M01) TaxID=1142394 RepID=I0II71_PHYMF|nr:response regulator [Phycisphaera mikurensis]MBB6442478.1 CheY-like chemotaxis protein [Phycisphaera mikurensis]BAM04959.1 putative response regulator receiver protein [Phycisphaera mikurensis NBRC 102666]
MPADPAATPPLVLLVDDESHILRLLALKLEGAGIAVATACNGAEALAVATQRHPSLIVSDFNMPVLDGAGLVAKLQADPTLHGIPVVLLTGRGHTLPPEALGSPSLVAVKRKPFSGREMLALVQEVLGSPAASGVAA